MNNALIRTLLAAAAVLALAGCSATGVPTAAMHDPVSGQHPANWTTTLHYTEFMKNPASCSPCHGSSVDPGAAGGTSKVSCFGCHHPSGPNHPAGWGDRINHGRHGAMAPAVAGDFTMAGMASCQACHGADFNTPVGVTPSCLKCHTKAPHPDAPWGATIPLPDQATSSRHDFTDQSNAPACFQCHFAGSPKNPFNPPSPAPSGTTPGCYNNTMCHGTSIPH